MGFFGKAWAAVNGLFHPLMQEYSPGRRDYGELPEDLKAQLEKIAPVKAWGKTCRPCLAVLADGTEVDRVYAISAAEYVGSGFRPWPDDLAEDRSLKLRDIRELRESPSRLPAAAVQKIYDRGETGMGYLRFTLVFADGSRQTYSSESVNIDFLKLPGRAPGEVVDAIPHRKFTGLQRLETPGYSWLLYGAGESGAVGWYGLGHKFRPEAKIKLVRR